ncbi:hypothetical protein ACJJTC_011941 [Scirpophaga incertulas]
MSILYILALFGAANVVIALSPALILTPYIERKEAALARNLSRVNPDSFLNITSHSGFLTVDLTYNSNLFFWFFPAADKPLNTTPWIVWLQGGPGATSMVGLFEEIGPFRCDKTGLNLREWSWAKNYSLLFIDNPVGAGYSFTDSDKGYVHNMEECSNHLYGALQQFLEVFPELRSAPLYLAGESYAGHFVPALAGKVLHPPPQMNKTNLKDISINLKGLIMGNPMIDRQDEVNLTSAYYNWGLIDTQGVIAARPLQEKYQRAIASKNETEASNVRNVLVDELSRLSYQVQTYNALKGDLKVNSFVEFITTSQVREAIHAGHDIQFTLSNVTVHEKLVPDFLNEMSSKVEELLEHYRILIYCGQLDLTVPCVPNAEARRKHWHWNGREEFLKSPRLPWVYNNSLAGYVKSGGRLTEVLVRNSGHLVPLDTPAQANDMITHFIRGIDLPLPTNFYKKDIETPPLDNRTNEEPPPSTARPPHVASPPPTSNGIITSVVLNVIFVVIIICGFIHWLRWKRRADAYFYNIVDNSSLNDAVLTMN